MDDVDVDVGDISRCPHEAAGIQRRGRIELLFDGSHERQRVAGVTPDVDIGAGDDALDPLNND